MLQLDQRALSAAGGVVLPHGAGVLLNGWSIAGRIAPISGASELEEISAMIGETHLPEMLFGSSLLELRHEQTGVTLRFCAQDALKAWKEEALPPVIVPVAASWQKARGVNPGFKQAVAASVKPYDWTFTTPYGGTLENASWVPVGAEADAPCIDRPLLMDTSQPILFQGAFDLYGSEMDDNGTCNFSVKWRVMPTCWYILLRLFVRVDGTLVRLREHRLFCATSVEKPLIVRETKWFEGTQEMLGVGILAKVGSDFADADRAAHILTTKASVATAKDTKEYSVLE